MGVLYTQALADRAQAWLSRPLTTGPEGKRSAEGLLELATIWAAIQQEPLPECIRQCQYSERYADVVAYLREFSRLPSSPTAMSDTAQSKYQFAPQFANETLVHEDLAGPVTAANLTDETAEFFIKQGRKDLFAKRGATEAEDTAAGESVSDETAPVGNPALDTEQTAHEATKQALASEKEAHKTTKGELKEVQKQLKDAQKQLEKAAKASEKAHDAATQGTDEQPA